MPAESGNYDESEEEALATLATMKREGEARERRCSLRSRSTVVRSAECNLPRNLCTGMRQTSRNERFILAHAALPECKILCFNPTTVAVSMHSHTLHSASV